MLVSDFTSKSFLSSEVFLPYIDMSHKLGGHLDPSSLGSLSATRFHSCVEPTAGCHRFIFRGFSALELVFIDFSKISDRL
jgi:hypothetical protein